MHTWPVPCVIPKLQQWRSQLLCCGRLKHPVCRQTEGILHISPCDQHPYSELLCRYQRITGHQVQACRFHVLRDDLVHGWLGASPDGLVDMLGAQPGKRLLAMLVLGSADCVAAEARA